MEKIDYAKHLNPEQLKVVKEADGACLVLAGAGSGKTRTLIYRVAYLLEKGIFPQNILLVTFTNKAAQQMKDRVELLLKKQIRTLWCGTFHHTGNRILRTYGRHIGIKADYNIMDEEDAKMLIKSCLRDLKINTKGRFFPAPKAIQSIISYSRNRKDSLSNTIGNYYPEFAIIMQELNAIYSLYTKKKAASCNLDYDDLLTETLRLLLQSQIACDKFTQQFQYILVDEYQDTNRLQFEIIKLLSERHKNVLAVGDDAQSIYAFRGAVIENILNFPKEYPGAKIFKLETNYRSSQGILDMANASINFNRNQYEKHLRSVRDYGTKPALINVKDLRAQSSFVIQKVLELVEEGYDLRKIAVLFRAHYQSAELEMELLKHDLPYVVRGGIRFFEQAHVKDVLSYLRIMQNPVDEIAWTRALSLEEGIGAGFSGKIFNNYAQQCKDLKDIFKDARWGFLKNKPKQAFEHFRKTIFTLNSADLDGRIDLMIEAVIENGYEKYCAAHFDNYKDRIDDLRALVNFAHTYKSLKKFLADTTLGETFKGETVIEPAKHESDFLVLSTIHQAKGLEWDAVIIIGLIDNQFPHPKAKEDLRQLEEERRLFYVASTRAKNYLYLIHPMTRYDYNYGVVIARPSLFIEELPPSSYNELEIANEDEALDDSQLIRDYDRI
ncbi:MAG: UvrD-helicase domain-containing protein [Candidatus Omnitrophota bacterium]